MAQVNPIFAIALGGFTAFSAFSLAASALALCGGLSLARRLGAAP